MAPAASRFSTNRSIGVPSPRNGWGSGRGSGGPPRRRRRDGPRVRSGLWSGLRLDVPEVGVGVVALLHDVGVGVGGEVALDAVPGVEPGLVDDVLVELRGGAVRVRLVTGLARGDEAGDRGVGLVEGV